MRWASLFLAGTSEVLTSQLPLDKERGRHRNVTFSMVSWCSQVRLLEASHPDEQEVGRRYVSRDSEYGTLLKHVHRNAN